MTVTAEDFEIWLAHPVTQAVRRMMDQKQSELLASWNALLLMNDVDGEDIHRLYITVSAQNALINDYLSLSAEDVTEDEQDKQA